MKTNYLCFGVIVTFVAILKCINVNAEIPATLLKGIDIFGTDQKYEKYENIKNLDYTRSISFRKSGLLNDLYLVGISVAPSTSIDAQIDNKKKESPKSPPKGDNVTQLIRSFFIYVPGEILPQTGLNKVMPYVTPGIIGNILGRYLAMTHGKEKKVTPIMELFTRFFLEDETFLSLIRKSRDYLCKTDNPQKFRHPFNRNNQKAICEQKQNISQPTNSAQLLDQLTNKVSEGSATYLFNLKTLMYISKSSQSVAASQKSYKLKSGGVSAAKPLLRNAFNNDFIKSLKSLLRIAVQYDAQGFNPLLSRIYMGILSHKTENRRDVHAYYTGVHKGYTSIGSMPSIELPKEWDELAYTLPSAKQRTLEANPLAIKTAVQSAFLKQDVANQNFERVIAQRYYEISQGQKIYGYSPLQIYSRYPHSPYANCVGGSIRNIILQILYHYTKRNPLNDDVADGDDGDKGGKVKNSRNAYNLKILEILGASQKLTAYFALHPDQKSQNGLKALEDWAEVVSGIKGMGIGYRLPVRANKEDRDHELDPGIYNLEKVLNAILFNRKQNRSTLKILDTFLKHENLLGKHFSIVTDTANFGTVLFEFDDVTIRLLMTAQHCIVNKLFKARSINVIEWFEDKESTLISAARNWQKPNAGKGLKWLEFAAMFANNNTLSRLAFKEKNLLYFLDIEGLAAVRTVASQFRNRNDISFIREFLVSSLITTPLDAGDLILLAEIPFGLDGLQKASQCWKENTTTSKLAIGQIYNSMNKRRETANFTSNEIGCMAAAVKFKRNLPTFFSRRFPQDIRTKKLRIEILSPVDTGGYNSQYISKYMDEKALSVVIEDMINSKELDEITELSYQRSSNADQVLYARSIVGTAPEFVNLTAVLNSMTRGGVVIDGLTLKLDAPELVSDKDVSRNFVTQIQNLAKLPEKIDFSLQNGDEFIKAVLDALLGQRKQLNVGVNQKIKIEFTIKPVSQKFLDDKNYQKAFDFSSSR